MLGAVGAELAYDVCQPATQQNAFGFNGSIVCAAFSIAKGAVDALWQSFELIDDTITSSRVDNTVKGLEHLGLEIGGISAGVDQANLKLDDVLFNQANNLQLRRLHVQVVELKEKTEFLVSATDAGRPVTDLELVSVRVSIGSSTSFVSIPLPPRTWELVDESSGIYRLAIRLPRKARNPQF